jgi:hypothetical protein
MTVENDPVMIERAMCLACIREVAALYTPQDTYAGSMQNPFVLKRLR